jgi:hypothetical protein
MLVVLATLLVAVLLGGVGGYLVKGLAAPSLATTHAAAPAVHSSEIPFVGRPPYLYEQGGRPLSVYEQNERTPSVYQQGGRPPVVYNSPTP